MNENSLLAEQDNSVFPIRSWVCVNQPVSLLCEKHDSAVFDDYVTEDDDEEEGSEEDEDYSAMASQHRQAILAAATVFAEAWKRPTRKRKCDIETAKVHKKLKLEMPFELVGAPKARSSRISTKPVAEKRKFKPVREPVKRYLRSNAKNRLNEVADSPAPPENTLTVPLSSDLCQLPALEHKEEDLPPQDDQAAGEGCSDTENQKSATSSDTESPNLKSSPNNQSYNQSDDELLTDLDDSMFDDEDLLFGDVTQLTDVNVDACPQQQIASPFPTQPECLASDSTIAVYDQETSSQPHTPMKPFLRATPEDPLASIKYSPIPRLIAPLRIPTCFRIAEALRLVKNTSSSSSTNPPLTIELFAKVSKIAVLSKESLQIRFADLFFALNPPFITGTYSGDAFKDGNRDVDTIYRAIVSFPPPRAGSKSQSVQVLAVRDATWDEVSYVHGIVDPDGAEALKKRK